MRITEWGNEKKPTVIWIYNSSQHVWRKYKVKGAYDFVGLTFTTDMTLISRRHSGYIIYFRPHPMTFSRSELERFYKWIKELLDLYGTKILDKRQTSGYVYAVNRELYNILKLIRNVAYKNPKALKTIISTIKPTKLEQVESVLKSTYTVV